MPIQNSLIIIINNASQPSQGLFVARQTTTSLNINNKKTKSNILFVLKRMPSNLIFRKSFIFIIRV